MTTATTTATIDFTPVSFPLPRLALSCADCGTRILDPTGQTTAEQDLGYRRIHFDLSDGTQAFVSFCPACADKPWDAERIALLERQCKYMWNRMANPGTKSGWSGDALSFRLANRPTQGWAEVQ